MSYKHIYTYIPLFTFEGTAYYSTERFVYVQLLMIICCHHNFVPCSHKFYPCVCLFPYHCLFIVNYLLTLYPIVILSWVPILYPYQDMRMSTSGYNPLSSYNIFYVSSCCTNSPQLGFCWVKKYESNIKELEPRNIKMCLKLNMSFIAFDENEANRGSDFKLFSQ